MQKWENQQINPIFLQVSPNSSKKS
jgi:hypothetical protein